MAKLTHSSAQLHRLLILLSLWLVLTVDVNAYIDPGTGSMAYQALLALALGAGLVCRRLVGRVWRFWRPRTPRER